jgi:hypothetical protein
LQETQGIRMSRLGCANAAGADQVDLERAVRYWVRRHAGAETKTSCSEQAWLKPVPQRSGV